MNLQRTFGVEIECVNQHLDNPGPELAQAITRESGIHCPYEGLHHITRNYWRVTHDGSTGANGTEIVSPPLSEDRLPEVEAVCAVLKSQRCIITPDCGLHVHVDARQPTPLDLTAMRQLAMLYVESENIVDLVLPPSRRQNNPAYCRSIARADVSKLMRCTSVSEIAHVLYIATGMNAMYGHRRRQQPLDEQARIERYVKLNFTSHWKHGTVEFRHHSGTIETAKIRQWIYACERFVETAIKEAASSDTVERTAARVARMVRAGTKYAIIHALLMRPEGVTKREVLAATGWENVSVQGTATAMGISVRKERVRGELGTKVYRYYGLREDQATPPREVARRQKPTTVAELCNRLEMTPEETSYWLGRAELFAQPTLNLMRE